MRSDILALTFLVAAISGAQAQAGGTTFLHAPMPLLGSPTVESSYTPAPVPSHDIALPRRSTPKPGEPEFAASLTTRTPGVRSGDGYMPGSVFSEELARKGRGGVTDGLTPMVGFSVSVDNR